MPTVSIEVFCYDCSRSPWMVSVNLPDEAVSSIHAFVKATAPIEEGIRGGHRVMHVMNNDYWHDIVTTWPILPPQLQQKDLELR
jgi:hypothetical protein